MTSRKIAASKRAASPRVSDYAKTFLKDWERLSRFGRFDLNRLKEVMMLLASNGGGFKVVVNVTTGDVR